MSDLLLIILLDAFRLCAIIGGSYKIVESWRPLFRGEGIDRPHPRLYGLAWTLLGCVALAAALPNFLASRFDYGLPFVTASKYGITLAWLLIYLAFAISSIVRVGRPMLVMTAYSALVPLAIFASWLDHGR